MAYNYWDWQNIFINELAGGMWIFFALSMIVIIYATARFRIPPTVTIAILGLWMLLLSPFGGFTVLLPIAVIFLGTFIFWEIWKVFNR